jgi:hypothetical protein
MNHDAREAIVLLLRGLLYRKDSERAWAELVGNSYGSIGDYFETIGLEVYIDESEGYAYLRQKEPVEGEPPLPRLIPARELGYKVSLLLVLLRKRIADFDMQSESTRAVVGHDELAESLLLFLPQAYDEVKQRREVDAAIRKAEELGFLKKLRGDEDTFEIRRAIKGFVDGQWLADFDAMLEAYRTMQEET